jgi:DNA repair protein SbcD/Mre11
MPVGKADVPRSALALGRRLCQVVCQCRFIAPGGAPPIAYRFLHTADLHLDSPLKSLAMRDAELAEQVGNATRFALQRIVDICLAEQVDALMIAGDLYDGSQRSMKTARFIGQEMKRLSDAGIRVFIIRGNHDFRSGITRELTLPENVTVFGAKAGVVRIERASGTEVAVHGLSFRAETAPQSLLPSYERPVAGAINVGLMHTSLGGSPGHDVYAPCAEAELMASGFTYWALGHIHKRSVRQGAATVVMPGMPQGRDINEDGAKSATLVTITDGGDVMLEERMIGTVIFRRVAVDLAGVDAWPVVSRRIAEAAADAATATGAATAILRVRLSGETPFAWRLRRDIDTLLEEAEVDIGDRRIRIEKIETACREPQRAEHGSDPLAVLSRIALDQVLASEGFRKAAVSEVEDFLRRAVPSEARDVLGGSPDENERQVIALAQRGVETLLARLRTDDAPQDE